MKRFGIADSSYYLLVSFLQATLAFDVSNLNNPHLFYICLLYFALEKNKLLQHTTPELPGPAAYLDFLKQY